ncbi:hypothetical protein Tco_1061636 [Tanacetum coccineum]
MDITRAQQIALDDTLVAPANRLKIGKSNLRLSSDLNFKEATLQVVYDVLKLTPFYKAFQITADVIEIYMQEFWATATVHHHSIHFKMNNKKHIVNLEYFREMLKICPKLHDQQFKELPFEEEILTFLRDLGHSREIKELNLLKQKQVSRRSKLDLTRQILLQLLKPKDSRLQQRQRRSKLLRRLKLKVSQCYLSEEEDDDEVGRNDDDDDNDYDDDDSDNQDDDGQEDDDNDGDDFVHPKFSTQDEEDIQEEGLDLRVHTPSHYESTDDEDSDEEIQGVDVEEEEMDEEDTNKEEEVDELYRDMNVNLEGRDTEMTNAPCTIIQTTQVIEGTHVIITLVNPERQQQSSSVSSGFISNMLNPSPDTGIDSIFNLNIESTSLEDVLVTTIAETPLLSATTLPPPPIPHIPHPQETPIPTPTTVPSSSLQDLPNFGSFFGFDHRLKTLETNFSKFKQINQFVAAVSSIPGIVDAYLANKMHEVVKIVVQLQSDRLRDEAQAENADFINKFDDNIKKIIKDQVKEQVKAQVSKILQKIKKTVNKQLEAEVLTRSSNKSKTSHAIAANLSEL